MFLGIAFTDHATIAWFSFYKNKDRAICSVFIVSNSECVTAGDTHRDITLLCFVILIAHGENLDTEDDTHDLVDNAHDTKGNDRKNYSENAGLGLTLHEARNTERIKNDTHNTKNDLVIHNYLHIKCYLVIKLYSYFLGVSIDFRENSSKEAKIRSFFDFAYEIRYNRRTNYSR